MVLQCHGRRPSSCRTVPQLPPGWLCCSSRHNEILCDSSPSTCRQTSTLSCPETVHMHSVTSCGRLRSANSGDGRLALRIGNVSHYQFSPSRSEQSSSVALDCYVERIVRCLRPRGLARRPAGLSMTLDTESFLDEP